MTCLPACLSGFIQHLSHLLLLSCCCSLFHPLHINPTGVTFRLNHAEKAGVVGRTGSGKSTLLLALYRMFELDKGTIRVDGVDVASLALRKLRPSLSIIPQEPVVFSGTVRSNLDPFGEFTDTAMWEVIKKANLESQVKAAGGIDGRVDGTGGQAWSLGQQQLVCLARAALRNVPVLCLDEATAAMDPHTEQEVQAVIKRVFQDRTTLTIAHRLDTVIESDQVLVMEAGVLKEMAPPSVLLDNRESMFSKLVDKTGAQAAAGLRQMAAEFFSRRAAGAAF
jgi:ABC-type multidrug transport system fused ATPase/permease subunit